jgi:hypothetical protein
VGATSDRVDRGAVGRAVVGQDALDGHAMARVERDRAVQKPNGGCGRLVAENLGVGQAAGVIDGDMDGVPARGDERHRRPCAWVTGYVRGRR